MKIRRKPSVRLPSSAQILIFPDESIDGSILTNLLQEAYEKGVHPFKKVIVGVKSRDWRFSSWGEDDRYKEVGVPIRLYELYQMWQDLPMVDSGQSYSPEAESTRDFCFGEAIRRRSEFPTRIKEVMYAQKLAIKQGLPGPFF